MSFYDNRYYRLNKILMSVTGLWPFQSRLEGNLTLIITALFIYSYMGLELWGLITGITDINIIMHNTSPLLMDSFITIKLINYLLQKHKMKRLLEHIEETWKIIPIGPENKILRNYAEQSRKYTMQYTISLYILAVIYCTMPIIVSGVYLILPLNETYTPRFLFRLEHLIDMDKYYNVLMIHIFIAVQYLITVMISVDCMFIICIQYVCSLFACIRHNMESIGSSDLVILKPNLTNDEAYYVIIQCVESYKRALKYSELLSSCFAVSFLFILGNVIISLTFNAAELIIAENQLDEIIRIVACNAGQVLHIFYLSLMAQQLIDHSSGLQDVIYSSNWYKISLRSRQLLRFMLLRATKPCEIKAGKLYIMSMENFSSILRVSASYFTVLTSVR